MGKKNKNKASDQRRYQKRVSAMKAACNKLGMETNNSIVIARKILSLQDRKLENERQFHIDAVISAFVKMPIDDKITYSHKPKFNAAMATKRVINKDKYEKKTKKTKRKQRKNEGFYVSKEWRVLRYEAFKIHGRQCLCCGEKPPNVILHVDHIKPRSKYPELELDINNLQILCENCNLGKSNKDEIDYRN